VLTLRFPRQGDVKGFQTGRYEDTLKEVLYARFGVNVAVRAISGGDPPPGERRRPGPEPVPPPAQPPAPQSPAPGSPAAGSPAPGSPAAGSPAPGSPAAGSPAPGSTAPGSTAAQPSRPDRAQPPSAPPAGALVGQGGTTRTFGDNVVSLPPDDEFDPDDEDMAAPASAELTGMALVQRELGAQIIGEFED
jgi:DNA polymerase III subunit gamma/tau